jgi:hypothetical protein
MNKIGIAYRNKGSWFAFIEITRKRLDRGFTKNCQVFIVKDYFHGMISVNQALKNLPFPDGPYCPWSKILIEEVK